MSLNIIQSKILDPPLTFVTVQVFLFLMKILTVSRDLVRVVDHLEMEMVYEIEKERDLTRNQGHQSYHLETERNMEQRLGQG